ncbi:MAG: family 20 glycosylhydrolase [Acidobacteria bacterium]|nr:family 20 glycosylhydrolase [Acidobacteriota bacterium]MCA1637950.1 family 20 glycosylhydrolase [Acidobacteriota bacterium]
MIYFFRQLFLLCAILFATLGVPAATPLQVIPQPKEAVATEDNFPLKNNSKIVLANSRSEADRFAAQDFIEDARATANVELKIGGGRGILIGLLENPKIRTELQKAKIEIPANLGDEGYVLFVDAKRIVVGGKTEVGTFYGLQTLKQMIRGEGATAYIQGARIIDFPTMRYRAFSDDISRGLVPTVDYVKRQIRTFAMFKMNMHSLYMEHTFASKSNPLYAPEEGSFTPEELREIVAYAQKYHIEIVPEQQTFGHLHKVIKFEKYNALAEVPYGDVLTPQEEGSYRLVADLYKEIDEIFPSKFFHIGADETFELGEGRSREETKEKGVGKVYFQHINRIRDILQPYNRRLMMWGDIALNHPELIGEIPKDVVVMNWAYGVSDSYMNRIEPFKKAGLEQFVCPSVWNFNLIFPNNEFATVNIRNFVRDGQAAGAIGVMNTNWDDDGETLFEMTWYGVALGAAAGWENAPLNVEKFDSKFDWAFFRSESDEFTKGIRTLGAASKTLGIRETQNSLFWQNPFTPPFQKRAVLLNANAKQLRLNVEAVEESLIRNGAKVKRNKEMIPAMRFAAQRFNHLGRRLILLEQFSQAYWEAYLTMSDRRKVRKLSWYSGAIYNYLREMSEELGELKRKYRQLYLAENKPSHLESVLARYDQSIQMWLDKSRQINEALTQYNETGTIPKPEEIGISARPKN